MKWIVHYNNMRRNITSNTRMCRRSYDVLGISKTTMMYLESLFADLDFFQFRDDESLKYHTINHSFVIVELGVLKLEIDI